MSEMTINYKKMFFKKKFMIYLGIISCSIILIIITIKFLKNPNITKIESWLLNNLFLFLIIIIGIILILYLIPIIIDAKFLNEQNKLKDLRLLDLKYTITSLGAIFAFWYGYKKYERDKKIEQINKLMDLSKEDSYKKTIIRWYTGLKMKNEGYIDKDLFHIIESYGETNFIAFIIKANNYDEINWKIAEILLIFNKNKYIIDFLLKVKLHWEKPENSIKNGNIFIEIIKKLEKEILKLNQIKPCTKK